MRGSRFFSLFFSFFLVDELIQIPIKSDHHRPANEMLFSLQYNNNTKFIYIVGDTNSITLAINSYLPTYFRVFGSLFHVFFQYKMRYLVVSKNKNP